MKLFCYTPQRRVNLYDTSQGYENLPKRQAKRMDKRIEVYLSLIWYLSTYITHQVFAPFQEAKYYLNGVVILAHGIN